MKGMNLIYLIFFISTIISFSSFVGIFICLEHEKLGEIFIGIFFTNILFFCPIISILGLIIETEWVYILALIPSMLCWILIIKIMLD